MNQGTFEMIQLSSRMLVTGQTMRKHQQGMVLITSLIMIVLLTLVVTISLSMSLTSTSVSKNLNSSMAAKAAAQRTIENLISNPGFVANPAAVAATPVAVDANGDGVADFNVVMSAVCAGARPVPSIELNETKPEDRVCRAGDSLSNSGIEVAAGTVSRNSLCTDTRWNIKATATGQNNSSRAEINQGVSVRMPMDSAATVCS